MAVSVASLSPSLEGGPIQAITAANTEPLHTTRLATRPAKLPCEQISPLSLLRIDIS